MVEMVNIIRTPSHPYFSPLRYPGGKGELLNFIRLTLVENGLSGGQYAEPYAGGAGLAIGLLFSETVRTVYVNDIDPGIWSFWHAVLNESDALCTLIETTAITIDEWYRQREIYRASSPDDPLSLGFSTFFLNRTNRSGILNAGPIGGKSQAGEWKLDARFNKRDLVQRIRRIARYKNRIQLSNLDAEEFLSSIAQKLGSASLIYLDPPYYQKGQELYRNFYCHADHARIARLLDSLTCPWLVSYDRCDEIEKLYGGKQNIIYKISYSAQEKRSGQEVMFFSDTVIPPDVSDPLNCAPVSEPRLL